MSLPFEILQNSSSDTRVDNLDELLNLKTEQLSLTGSNDDVTFFAWIPSKSSKDIFLKILTNPSEAFNIEKKILTMPGIAIKEDFNDPVKNLVKTYHGEEVASELTTVTSASVTQDDRGLRQLITKGCYHAAVNLTTQLLTVYGQGEGRIGQPSKHTAHSIQLWFTRIALLIKLRRFSLAEVECEAFKDLDAPDLYFEFYPELYGGKKGSLAPFQFRILIASLPQYLGKHSTALNNLSKILMTCDQILKNLKQGLNESGEDVFTRASLEAALSVWQKRRVRTLYALANCAVGFKSFRLATSLLNTLLEEDPESVSKLYSAVGRLYLHLGDTASAQEAFNRYLEYSPVGAQHDPVQGLLHSALLCCAQNAYLDATQILQQAYKIAPDNALVINNLGVAMMFLGEIRAAIKLVEDALSAHPEQLLHEALILNLATMYELESSNAHKKKLDILNLVYKYKGDGFNVAALKLQVT